MNSITANSATKKPLNTDAASLADLVAIYTQKLKGLEKEAFEKIKKVQIRAEKRKIERIKSN